MSGARFTGVAGRPQAPLVAYAFGEAGSGAAAWRHLREELADAAEVRALRLPGRESRYGEPPIATIAAQLDDLTGELIDLVQDDDRPYLLVGHCSGAVTAYECGRHLQARALRPPSALVVGQQRSPAELPGPMPPVHEYSGEQFREWCRTALAHRPELSRPDVFEFFAPMLHADFSVVSRYRHRADPLLRCPVIALGGAETGGWARITTESCRSYSVAGTVTVGDFAEPIRELARAQSTSKRAIR